MALALAFCAEGDTLSDTIAFSLAVTNNYVNTISPQIGLNIMGGSPAYYAVSVDDANYDADAVWLPYAGTNINVVLGTEEGWHQLWIGLKGPAPNATVTWQWKRLNLDLTPPLIVITNPAITTVDVPIIQLQGYSTKPLSSISYDLTNAAGLVSNQQALIVDQLYDAGTGAFTTNTFQGFDIPLTNGLNVITINATDLAGNATTTNFSYTLDYSDKTNPPVFTLTWPSDGTQISGTNFTLNGIAKDPSVTVSATVTDTNGDTNVRMGEVERTGKFWIDNIPLNAGTNAVTITVRDAAGNTNATTINVLQSALILTVDPVTPDSQLWQPTVSLRGKISDPSQAVWVNGVKGHNNGDGTWSAHNVPTTAGGTASFTITAYEPTEQQPDGSYGN